MNLNIALLSQGLLSMIVVNDHFREQSGLANSRKIFSFSRLKEDGISY